MLTILTSYLTLVVIIYPAPLKSCLHKVFFSFVLTLHLLWKHFKQFVYVFADHHICIIGELHLLQDDGIINKNYIFICTTNASIIWVAILFSYKGLLQILAMFMAFHTRKVTIKALNESLEIAALIYINSIILVMLTVTEFVLYEYREVYVTLFGLALIIGATLFLGLIFAPKVYI